MNLIKRILRIRRDKQNFTLQQWLVRMRELGIGTKDGKPVQT